MTTTDTVNTFNADDPRDRVAAMRVNRLELAWLRVAARVRGLTVSEYLREIVLPEAKRAYEDVMELAA